MIRLPLPRAFVLLLVLLGAVTGTLVGLSPARAQTTEIIRVAPSGQDNNTCGSAAAPCATINQGIDRARNFEARIFRTAEIRVAAGTYRNNRDVRLSVAMLNFNGTLTVRGGYSTGNWDVSNPTANETIIDGDNRSRGISIVPLNFSDAARAAGCNIEVSGFTVVKGSASATVYDGPAGGGAYVSNGCVNARLSNLVIKNNKAQGSGNAPYGIGGGIAVLGTASNDSRTCVTPTTATLTNITLTDNTAQGDTGVGGGGGLYVLCGNVQVNGLSASGNTARGGTNTTGIGGGITIITTPSFALNNVEISKNTAQGNGTGAGEGGGMFIELSTGTVNRTTIRENQATGSSIFGGGVFASDSNVTMTNSTVAQNTGTASAGAAAGGGILLTRANAQAPLGTFIGRNLFITGNTAASAQGASGGGFFCDGNTFTLNNATLVGNAISGGSGLDYYGAALNLAGVGGCSGTFSNSILVQTGSFSPVFVNSTTGTIIFNTNLINVEAASPFAGPLDKITNTNSFGGDPRFVSASDFHITPESAAIDRANSSAEAQDIDGQARPFGTAADVGADEYVVQKVLPPVAYLPLMTR